MKFEQEVSAIKDAGSVIATSHRWEIVRADYPVLALIFAHPRAHRRVGFRFVCDGWDEQPPSLALFDPETEADLTWENWPRGGWSVHSSHPLTGKPFLCLPGIREYHIHPSHLKNPWSSYKPSEGYKLRYIVHRVQQRFGDTNG